MSITLSIVELIIGFGGLTAFVLTLAFILRMKLNNLAAIWFIGFCLANVFVIFIKILYATGYIYELPHLLRWKFPIGLSRPVLFFLFILYLYKGYSKIKWQNLLHFIPVVFVLIYFIPFYLEPASLKVGWLKGENILANANVPFWYFYFIVLYSVFYLIRAALIFIKHRQLTSKLLNIFISLIFITTVVFLIAATSNVFSTSQMAINNLMYLVLSIGFITGSIVILAFQKDLNIRKNIKYQSSNITQERSKEIFEKAQQLLKQEKAFKDPELKLTDLAAKIKEPPYLLSHSINQQTGKTFNDFINQRRVDEATDLITDGNYEHLTLEAIGYEVGFNSRSSFYSAFRKIKKSTPAAFKKLLSS